MGVDRARVRAAGTALVRFGLFVVLFLVLLQLMPMLAAAVIAGLLLLRVVDKRPLRDLGFQLDRTIAPELLLGMALGIAGLVLACALLVLTGSLRFTPDGGTAREWLAGIISMLIVLAGPAAAEEALFRGYPFQKLVEGFGAIAATVVASAAFALAHAGNPSVNAFALANIFAAGVMLSVAYLATRSLWFATAVHLGWNWSMAALLDLPVSGLELFDAPLYEPLDRGPGWLTGGTFGPEAGVAGFIGLALVLGGVVGLTRKTRWLT